METKDNVTKVDLRQNQEATIYKADLRKPTTDETTETEANATGVVGSDENTDTPQEQEEVQPQGEVQETETPVLEEIKSDEVEQKVEAQTQESEEVKPEVEKVVEEVKSVVKDLPENIQKLVEFMNDTGGSVQDYVRLNTDINKLDTSEVLDEYYKQVKSHLSAEERGFLLEETFSYDEELDDAKEIKRKKIKLKEEAAKARKYLEGQKSKYYEEIKASTTLTEDQQRAIDFYNKYNKDSKAQKAATEASTKEFQQKTKDVFNDDFKGFDFNVGEKTFRYNVKNKGEVMNAQSDLNNFINKFVGSDNKIQDAKGYHKSLYTAMNADALAQHFYEQGKADAIKDAVARGKNVNTEARQTHGETQVGGVKYKILGESANNFKLKFKK